jgi:hypothetical protein
MPRNNRKKTIKTSAELRELLTTLSPDAVSILKDVMFDDKIEAKLRVDVAKFIITQVLDDPELINTGDNLVKLAAILKE